LEHLQLESAAEDQAHREQQSQLQQVVSEMQASRLASR
jgi:hypothetical protein